MIFLMLDYLNERAGTVLSFNSSDDTAGTQEEEMCGCS